MLVQVQQCAFVDAGIFLQSSRTDPEIVQTLLLLQSP